MRVGVIEKEKVGLAKQVVTYSTINPKTEPGVNHNQSVHTQSLQRSKYICIDDSVDKEYVVRNQLQK